MTETEHADHSGPKNDTARDLRKRIKRLLESRDGLKKKSRQQAERIRSLTGKALELKESRDLWRKHFNYCKEEKNTLEMQLEAERKKAGKMSALAEERARVLEIEKKAKDEEKLKYEEEINELKKKLKKLIG